MRLTIYDKILLHLFEYKAHRNDPQMPESLTQHGIAECVGISVTHVPRSVEKLVMQGQVFEASTHVKLSQRKKKTYHLTTKGITTCMEMRERIGRMECIYSEGEGTETRTMTYSKVFEALKQRCAKRRKPIPTFFEMLKFIGDGDELRYEPFVDGLERPDEETGREKDDAAPFFGRSKEMNYLLGSFTSGTNVCILLSGEEGIGKSALLHAGIREAKGRAATNQVMWISSEPNDLARIKEFSMDLFRSEKKGHRLVAFDIDHDGKKDVSGIIRVVKELMASPGPNIIVITCLVDGQRHLEKALVGIKVMSLELGPLDLDILKRLAPEHIKSTQLKALSALSKGNPKRFLAALSAPDITSKDDLDEHQKALLKVLRSKD